MRLSKARTFFFLSSLRAREFLSTRFLALGNKFNRAVICGRQGGYWQYISIGLWNTDLPEIARTVVATLKNTQSSPSQWRLFLRGGRKLEDDRLIVSIFSAKWLAHDKHSPCSNDGPDSALTCGGAVILGIPPNTVERDGDLHLDADSLRGCDERHEARAQCAEEAKADHGEIEFHVGSSLRVTWCTAQRAYPSLARMFSPKQDI